MPNCVFLSRLAVILCCALFVACTSTDEAEIRKREPLVDFKHTVDFKRVWSVSAGAGSQSSFSRFLPAIADKRIFVADTNGRIFAFDAITGDPLWLQDIEVKIAAATGAGSGLVLVATYDGEVFALEASNGKVRWQAKASSEVLAPPVTNGSLVVATSIDGHVFAFDAETGEQRWRYNHALPVLSLRSAASALITSTQVIVPLDNGQVLSLSASSGSNMWDARVGQPQGTSELERVVDVDTTPILLGGIVYAASYQGSLVALSRVQGNILWRKKLSTHNNLATDGRLVYATTDKSEVLAFQAGNGQLAWQNDALYRRNLGSPAVIGDYLVSIDDEDHLHVMKTSDGSFVHRFKPRGSGFRADPVAAHQLLYILSDNGRLSAYRIAD